MARSCALCNVGRDIALPPSTTSPRQASAEAAEWRRKYEELLRSSTSLMEKPAVGATLQCATTASSTGGVTSADGGVCVGPAAAAAVAAAGMRHWLRNGSTPPGTPLRGSRSVASPRGIEHLELGGSVHAVHVDDSRGSSDDGSDDSRAHFRLLCTLPDELPSDEALVSSACVTADEGPLTHRHVAAVLAEDACVVSEDTMAGMASTTNTRTPSTGVALHLEWLRPPRRALMVVKPDGGPGIEEAIRRCAKLLMQSNCCVYVEPSTVDRVQRALAAASPGGADPAVSGMIKSWDAASQHKPPEDVAQALDLVVALGGDGTLLWLSHLLGDAPIPPVLAVGLGSLCFLSPFTVGQLDHAVRLGLAGGFQITLRHRLKCRIVRCRGDDGGNCVGSTTHHIALNECAIDRGTNPLTNLECFIDGIFVTRVQGDGLIVATPSGSTAYSLAAGGSIAHPTVPGLLLTPIAAHSLSFRPLVFPDSVRLCVRVPTDGRARPCFASFDGRDRTELRPGDAVHISLSRWPMPTICSRDSTADFVFSITHTLHWNERRTQGVARED